MLPALQKSFMPICLCLFALSWQAQVQARTPADALLIGQVAEPQSLDPQVATAANDSRILVNVYDGLVRNGEGKLDIEPALATRWTISPDGLTYRFYLREGVKFQDGTPFNADAVKFTFDRMLDDKNPWHDTGPFPLSFFFSSIKNIETPDQNTLVFTLKEPFSPFLSNLATPTGLIVSPAAVKKYGKEFGRHPVGTGAFRFAEWKANQRVVVTANSDYWDGKPAVQNVVFRPITDGNTRVAEMLSGGIDAMVEVPPDTVKLFKEKSDRFRLYQTTGPHVWYVMLNTQVPPFNDVRVRQAVNYAINKQSLTDKILQGSADVAEGPIPRAFNWAANKEVTPYPYDPTKARALLKAAGAEGTTLTFYVAEGGSGMLDPIPMATAIQADLKAVGLNVSLQTYEWNTYLSKVNAGLDNHTHMAEMAWMTNDPDTLPFLTLRTDAWPKKGGFNSGYYSNPQVDNLLQQARMTTDTATRAALYRQVQQLVHDDAPWIFVANWKQNAVTSTRIQHFALQPNFNLLLNRVTKQ
ncbi:ABC transporter substrate-binding protein [Rahnella aceris]|uniref:ABC transporter substrate-binding protein n=1 Tax=Rahnella sp. (strain Y9602) TaxID=2703885 RepID=UPI001C25E448|nr:ABC transporter substrate-binding protein [Rahnella aceris]MBU9849852.1 ABC transporter substrate-binding protein [Rahnella aceris]